jgi:hypothetical protein
MMRDGFVFAQFVFLIQSFGRSPATTQAEAAVELLPAAVTKQHQAHAMYTHTSQWCGATHREQSQKASSSRAWKYSRFMSEQS